MIYLSKDWPCRETFSCKISKCFISFWLFPQQMSLDSVERETQIATWRETRREKERERETRREKETQGEKERKKERESERERESVIQNTCRDYENRMNMLRIWRSIGIEIF